MARHTITTVKSARVRTIVEVAKRLDCDLSYAGIICKKVCRRTGKRLSELSSDDVVAFLLLLNGGGNHGT